MFLADSSAAITALSNTSGYPMINIRYRLSLKDDLDNFNWKYGRV
jgi:hypothetical protein